MTAPKYRNSGTRAAAKADIMATGAIWTKGTTLGGLRALASQRGLSNAEVDKILKAASQHVWELRRDKVIRDTKAEFKEVGRPRRSGALIKALAMQRNGHVTANGYEYVLRSYMDTKLNDHGFRYWQIWEEGARKSQWAIHGHFLGPDGTSRPSQGRRRKDARFVKTSTYRTVKGERGAPDTRRVSKMSNESLREHGVHAVDSVMMVRKPYRGSHVLATNRRYDIQRGQRDLRTAIKAEANRAGAQWMAALVA